MKSSGSRVTTIEADAPMLLLSIVIAAKEVKPSRDYVRKKVVTKRGQGHGFLWLVWSAHVWLYL
jgi:hypothetical protein